MTKSISDKSMMDVKCIRFRKITINDLDVLKKWRNSDFIWQYNTQYTLLNRINQKKWFRLITNKNSNRIMFIVTVNNKPIAVCGLINIDMQQKSGSVAIILGEKKYHGKGYGSEILRLLIQYGFKKLKLHRIEAEVFAYNLSSLRLFTRLHFSHEATLRESLWRNGKWWNVLIFSLLKNEF